MRRRILILAALVSVLLGGVALWAGLRDGAEEHMAAYVAELRARGEPATLAEMDPPLPPEDENGARELEIALDWLARQLEQESERVEEWSWSAHYVGPWNFEMESPWHEHATPEQIDELRAFLATCKPFFEHVDAAARMPEIAWPGSMFEDEIAAFGSRGYSGWGESEKILAAWSRVAPDAADRERAIVTLLRLHRRMRLRTGLDHLITASRRRWGCVLLRDGVEEGWLDPVALRARCDSLLAGDSVASMPEILRRHRASAIEFLPELLDGSVQANLRNAQRTLSGTKPNLWDRIGDGVQDRFAGVSFPWREYLQGLRDLDAILPPEGEWSAEAERALASYSGGDWDNGFLMRLMLILRSADAAERLARVALAASEHRILHDEWPSAPADLAPLFGDGVPVDPYTGDPFVMERDGDALVLRAQPPDGALTSEDDTLRSTALEWRLEPR